MKMIGGEGHPAGAWTARLAFDPTAFVAPGAIVSGDVTLGPRSSVWFNTVIRGDTAPVSVGVDSNVQDGSVVHVDEGYPARIGARVTVGHRAIIHGCTIEDDSLIGMGAIVLSGATIGSGSLIAAGALVREGQEIPPGSLVIGAPARIHGLVHDSHREAIRHGAQHYVDLSRSYLRRGHARIHPPRGADAGTSTRDRGVMSHVEWASTRCHSRRHPRVDSSPYRRAFRGGAASPARSRALERDRGSVPLARRGPRRAGSASGAFHDRVRA